MAESASATQPKPAAGEAAPTPAAPPPRRSPGHRGQDIRDTVAEMAAKAQEISMEAGSKMAAAMKDVIGAAAGLSSFAIESARDLVQYMVRRGQMTQEEADKLIREVEDAQARRKPGSAAAERVPAPRAAKATPPEARKAPAAKAALQTAAQKTGTAKKSAAAKPAAKKSAAKKPAAKKPAAKKAPATTGAAKKTAAKPKRR